MTLTGLLAEVTTLLTSIVPDFAIFIAAGIVIAGLSVLVSRLLRGTR